MDSKHHSIFRTDAIRRYVASREEAVLPRWVSPRTFLYLWFLLGLLLVSSLAAWFAKVPVYVSGSAIVVRSRGESQGDLDHLVVAIFFPAQNRPRLQVDQRVVLHFEGIQDAPNNHNFSRSILAVEPAILSPDAAQKRFDLSSGTASTITQPVVVAIASLEPSPKSLPASVYLGSVGKAEVVVGSQRILSLFPLIGSLIQND
jgi:hypothetical protein